jgi:short-subunit dehydrogenase
MKDKVVIITGASSGIGYACAEYFAKKGCSVVLAARNVEKINNLQADLIKLGYNALAVKTDITQESECRNLIEATVNKYNRIDVLINNAGISMRAIFDKVELDVLKQLMNVNFWGTVFCSKYALPHLIKTQGSVIGVSSLAGLKGLPGRTGYSASKFAMHGFLETLRAENLKKKLHVMIATPDFTASEIRKRALVANGNMQGKTPLNENKLVPAEVVAAKIYKGWKKKKRTLLLTSKGKMMYVMKFIAPTLLDNITFKTMAKEPDSPFK